MERIRAQTSSAASPPVLQLMAMSAPAWARANATARPIPRELPVTKAFLPLRSKVGTSSSRGMGFPDALAMVKLSDCSRSGSCLFHPSLRTRLAARALAGAPLGGRPVARAQRLLDRLEPLLNLLEACE